MLTVNRILIILAVDALGERSFGVNVGNLIVNTTGRHESLKRGVYVTLHRLRDIGYLDQYVAGDRTPRPFYRVTDKGRRELVRTLEEFEELSKLVRRAMRKAA